MSTKLGIFAVISLSLLMLTPAYASVTSVSLSKSFFTIDENIKFVGEQEGQEMVHVMIFNPNGKFETVLSDPTPQQGTFEVFPKPVDSIFGIKGIYTATAFTDSDYVENGTSIKLEFNGDRVFEVPDFVLELKAISDKEVNELKTISFTVEITDSSVGDIMYSLGGEEHYGATIDSDTGKFVWTPTGSHGNDPPAEYNFEIIATKGSQTDKEKITIFVKEPNAVNPEPEPEEKTDTKQTTNEPEELEIPAPFVDETKDPQSYVDRYNDEAGYKKWFDDNYPEYSSIYQAVGLEGPKVLAPFVDPNLDPQYYVDRYNNEITYKDWFDKTYPEMTIYEAVGLEEPEVVEPEFGECGEGTKLVDGKCTVIPSKSKAGGGCLVATAAYGSEMAPQVQFLREIRDNQLMSTNSGVSFMTGFNQVYYSFSPYVADMQRENPMFKEIVKIGITPLLSSLSVMEYAESESQVLGYGIGVILMNIGMYFAVPAMLFFGIRKLRRVRF